MRVSYPDNMTEQDINENNFDKVGITSNNHSYNKIHKDL